MGAARPQIKSLHLMEKPLEISYRNVSATTEIDKQIRQRVDKLETICDHVISCMVAVEDLQTAQRSGSEYRVRVDVRVPPRHELCATHKEGQGTEGGTIFQSISQAFDAMEKQLRKLNDKQKGLVKTKEQDIAAGIVSKLFREMGYGFIKSIDGREVYFHRNSVLSNGFDHLELGAGVMFSEEHGEDGPQATTIHIVDKVGRDSPQNG